MSFSPVNPKKSMSELEHERLDAWAKSDLFNKTLNLRKNEDKYVFYDGPPFANGLPHYGHILAGSIKDAVTRYASMKGYSVPRINGWDCHGLPVEYEIEKQHNLSGRQDIEKMGIAEFNEECRKSVFSYTEQWDELLVRMARWVDMENRYATLDVNFMESIWWVFKEIWKKGLLVRGHKCMHICPRCATPLSNFEVSQAYRDVTDLSVTAKFRSKKNPKLFFLAWTTTPWTLPGNVALAVNPDVRYVKIRVGDEELVLAKELLEANVDLNEIEVLEEFMGEVLVGEEYEPLFNYYENDYGMENAWKILPAEFVGIDNGTGIVHIASAYGEDDYELSMKHKIPVVQHVNIQGLFEREVKDFADKFVKGQDQNIVKFLKEKNLVWSSANYRHSYPHCWRCDTPLLNFAMKSWFVKVTEIKDRLIENNKKIHWQPAHVKEGRFGKWLESVRDWNISRNRFWGTPMPIWECSGCAHIHCVGSVNELKELAGELPMRNGEVDLHKPMIDEISMPCKKCGETMKRIPEVLDCWFESGAMPYAQWHYPFENKELFEANFPADFIAEGVDQTRGWFYTLHVLSTILFDEPAFKNVIVNGILLAEDGEKLSKRKQNYPDPNVLFESKGVDTLRLFLFSSTAPLGEDVRFSERHVDELMKKFTLTLWNTYSFFVTYANIDGVTMGEKKTKSTNQLDKWILSELNSLIKVVTESMDKYNLSAATRPMIDFVDILSNWYLRRSRRRFWKSGQDADKDCAYETLHTVLCELSKLLAPFMPFLSDEIYVNLSGKESVHLCDWPKFKEDEIDDLLNLEMSRLRKIVNLGHSLRAKKKIRVRQPLNSIQLVLPKSWSSSFIESQKDVILEELNVKKMEILLDANELAEPILVLNSKVLGPKYGQAVQQMIADAKNGNFKQMEDGTLMLGDIILLPEEAELAYKGKEGMDLESEGGLVLALDTYLSPELLKEGMVRELLRHVQDLRKDANYNLSDRIYLFVATEGELEEALVLFSEMIKEETLAIELSQSGDFESDLEKEVDISGFSVKIAVRKV